jgi:poly(A) polymerase
MLTGEMYKRMESLPHHDLLSHIGETGDRLGIEVYAVGGYVRDWLLGTVVKDIDFVVIGDGPKFARAVGQDLRADKVSVYKHFGTARVAYRDFVLEFVGARKESYRSDSRKPCVEPADLRDDLARRDFTINAMAICLNKDQIGLLVDPFGGQRDLRRKLIRTPLDPLETFKDDPLRIMRAIRFATWFRFRIENETKDAICRMRERLKIVSQERVTDEFLKVLAAPQPSHGFLLMSDTGVLDVVFPELVAMRGVEERKGYHHKDVFYHTLKVLDNVAQRSGKLELRFAALVHDIGKPRTKQFADTKGWTFHGHEEVGARMIPRIGRRLRLPNNMIDYAQKLTRLHLRPIALTEEDVTDSAYRRVLVQAGDDLEDLLTLCRADITSRNPRKVQRHLKNFDYVVMRLQEVEEKDRMRAFQSPVRGDEIMRVTGTRPGPIVGKLKMMIEEAILEGKIPNEHEAALKYLMEIKDDVLASEFEEAR